MVDDRQRARELLADLEETLELLREKQGIPYDRYENDVDIRDFVERRLEKTTKTCVDIGRRVGRLEGMDLGDTNTDLFVALDEAEVLPARRRQERIDTAGSETC